MRTLQTTILFLILSIALRAQSPLDSLVLTKEQNDKWILRLEKETKPKQLGIIKSRILQDTNVYIPQYYPDGIKFDNEKARGKRTNGYAKPLLIFNGQLFIYINNDTKSKSITKLTEFLTDRNIKQISILKGTTATALYGSRGDCGVILLTTKDKRTLRRIGEIEFKGGYFIKGD